MIEEDVQLLTLRKEMSALMKKENDYSQPSDLIKNERLIELEKAVKAMEEQRPSMLCHSSVIRYDYDDIPIGSILFWIVFKNKQSTLRNRYTL